MNTTTTPNTPPDVQRFIEHSDGCPETRIEETKHPDEIVTAQCLDCGQHFPDGPLVSGALAEKINPVARYRDEIARAQRRIARKGNN